MGNVYFAKLKDSVVPVLAVSSHVSAADAKDVDGVRHYFVAPKGIGKWAVNRSWIFPIFNAFLN